MSNSPEAKCIFCGKESDLESAMDSGWYPTFDGPDGEEVDGPICDSCSVEHLDYVNGAMVLKPGHKHPADEA